MKTLVFDFFGVISSEVSPIWMKKYFSDDIVYKLRNTYNKDLDTGDIEFKEFIDKLSELSGIPRDIITKEWYELARINWGVVEIIKEYKSKYKIALLSNASSLFIRNIMHKTNLEQYFDEILVSGEVGIAKPNPKMFELLLDRMNIKPEEAIMIDDSIVNIDSASRVGMRTIHFKSSEQLNIELKKAILF